MGEPVAIHIGSTREIFAGRNPGTLRMVMGGKLSAFDVGPCPHIFDGIDAARIDFAQQFFALLTGEGISHNFMDRDSCNSIVVTEFRRYELRDQQYHLLEPFTGVDNGRLLPLEFICRMEVATKGLLDRLEDPDDPLTLERLGITKTPEIGSKLPFFVECSTKLEEKDRYFSRDEAMQIGDLDNSVMLLCEQVTCRIGGLLQKQAVGRFRVKDFKIELAIGNDGRVYVADLLSPDEMRLVDMNDVSHDKDIFREWLVMAGFKKAVDAARATALASGLGPVYPAYPDVPTDISLRVTTGYCHAVRGFWELSA